VESAVNPYIAAMPYYWISANTMMLNVQEQFFINTEDFDIDCCFFFFS